MSLTLYGCGYNGFAQISGFQTQDLDGWTCGICKHDPIKQDKNVNITSPVALMQLAECVHVKNVVFTWARIATALCKDGKDVSLVAGRGKLDANEESKDTDLSYQADGQAVTATDAHIILRLAEDKTEYGCLHDEHLQTVPLVFQDEPENPAGCPVQLHASHTDVYYTRGSLEFGKLVLTDPEKEAKSKHQFVGALFRLLPVDMSVRVAQVSCGREHTILLSTFGCVYTCGLGSRGQLGHGDVEMEHTPRLVEALEGVRMLSCRAGGWHSACVSETHDLYTWGWNESGQLGLASPSDSQQTTLGSVKQGASNQPAGLVVEPQCASLPQDVDVKAVACGSRHTLVLSVCGQVFSCGWNAYGQLGLMHTKSQSTFVKVASLGSSVKQIYAGQWCSMFVCLK